MIFSMTGFGRAEYEDSQVSISIEIKSLNHRFFEIAFYLPDSFNFLEERLREKMSNRIKRGRIFLHLNFRLNKLEDANVVVNETLAKKMVSSFDALRKKLGVNSELSIKDIVSFPNVVKIAPLPENKLQFLPKINVLVDKAIDDLMQMRSTEGEALFKDINSRIKRISSALKIIESESPRIINHFKAKMRTYLKSGTYSQEKLVEEVGVFARSIDISEEVVRLKSHLNNFSALLLNKQIEKGRTLDFIGQEMQREINTIGSKSGNINIAKQVVVVKSEIDKIREQLSNVE